MELTGNSSNKHTFWANWLTCNWILRANECVFFNFSTR